MNSILVLLCSAWIYSISVIFLISANAQAGGIDFRKYTLDFLSTGVGARALGMGGAFTSVANDVSAGYWNPAGLIKITFPQIILMHDSRYNDVVSYNYGAVAVPLSKTESVALSAFVLSVNGIPNTVNAFNSITDRIDVSKVTYFGATEMALFGSYSRKVSEKFSFGANVKFIRENIGSTYGTGIGFDVGVLFLPTENLSFGGDLQNATTTIVAWTTGTTELSYPVVVIGASYKFRIGKVELLPAVDGVFNIDNMRKSSMVYAGPVSADVRAGAEVTYENVVALRAGYNEVKQFTVGAGLYLPKLEIDYSFARFAYNDALGDSHRISMTLTIGN